MAQYIRFDVYIPVAFTVLETNPQTGAQREVFHALTEPDLRRFLDACKRQYHGYTRAHPQAPTPYKGWWKPAQGSEVSIDHLTHIFVLVAITDEDKALQFFRRWSKKLAASTHQV